MIVKSIKLTSFRNFESGTAVFEPSANIFQGKNGAGKSNLLEAIFMLLLGKSTRGAKDGMLVKEGGDFYRIEGEVEAENDSNQVSIAYQIPGKRKVLVNKRLTKTSELFGKFCAVSAGPSDIEIFAGSPSIRRNFLNLHLSQMSPRYFNVLGDYHKAVEQKNAWLKQSRMKQSNPYNELIAKYGAIIMMERKKFLNLIWPGAENLYRKVSSGQSFMISYSPSVVIEDDSWTEEKIRTVILEKLRLNENRERLLQMAMIGPHRDEIEFTIEGYPARSHGSQGEMRTAAISLKLAIFEHLKNVRKEVPVLLMDEIFAELDETRRERLMEAFGQFGQLFLTTATEIPGLLTQGGKRFRIEDGSIRPQ